MNVRPRVLDPSSPDADAAHWFALQRRGLMTAEEYAAYQLWHADRANRAQYKKLELLWEDLARLAPATDRSPQVVDAWRRRVALASGFLLMIGAVLICIVSEAPFWNALDWTTR